MLPTDEHCPGHALVPVITDESEQSSASYGFTDPLVEELIKLRRPRPYPFRDFFPREVLPQNFSAEVLLWMDYWHFYGVERQRSFTEICAFYRSYLDEIKWHCLENLNVQCVAAKFNKPLYMVIYFNGNQCCVVYVNYLRIEERHRKSVFKYRE